MGKFYAIVSKETGEEDGQEYAGTYYVGSDVDMSLHPYDKTTCILVELTAEEYRELRHAGIDVERNGKTVFIDKIKDLQPTDKILRNSCPNKIDVTKAKKKICERPIEDYAVNLHGVNYMDQRPVRATIRRVLK